MFGGLHQQLCRPLLSQLGGAAGGRQAGICSEAVYITAGDDIDQQAGLCGTLTFKIYTDPGASVQVSPGAASSTTAA